MTFKSSKFTHLTSKSSTILHILLLLTFLPHQSVQQEPPNDYPNVTALCIYRYDPDNIYTCDLHNATNPHPNGVLNIIGTHLPGHTDDDVRAVVHIHPDYFQFNGEVLRKFVNLQIMSLSSSGLSRVSETAFDRCDKLEVLNMRLHFQLTRFPPRMLANCRNLRRVNFDFNRIQALPDDLFGDGTALEHFSMRSNTMTSFPDNLLLNMTNLRIFDAENNQITSLSRNNFVNAVNLEQFSIGWNRLTDAQEVMNLLNGHLRLKTIRLNENRFPMFNFNFLSQFQQLEVLAAGGNQNLTGIAWQSLPTSLKYLRIVEIGEEIPENAFNHLTNLTELLLTGLGISNLQRDTFKELTNLQVLQVTQASIRTLNPQLFQGLVNLHTLNFQENQIEALPDGIFVPLVSLGLGSFQRVLTMSFNRITRLPITLFGQHPHMFHIDFSFNRIDGIQRGIFSRFRPLMTQAVFQANICTGASLWNETNLDQHREFELCFNNFDGIVTTTPNGTGSKFGGITIFLIIFIKFLTFLL